jgi:hypothetical protein
MANRKNLNDVIHGDRADVRASIHADGRKTWDEWQAGRDHKQQDVKPSDGKTRNAKLLEDWQADGHSATSNAFYPATSTKSVYADDDLPGAYAKCYASHGALLLPGTDKVVHGGSCWTPSVKDADVYIGFDSGMQSTAMAWPWTPGDEVKYPVQDMSVPTDPATFKNLVTWTKAQLDAGRKVHCGCIGGHGRTGMFLAALVSEYGERDAIAYVRKGYCVKAVESASQVAFLSRHFGVTRIEPTKTYAKSEPTKAYSPAPKKTPVALGKPERFAPLAGNGSIWG